MSEIYKIYENSTHLLKIFYDDDALSPRQDYDNLGVMVCDTKKYRFGDVQCKEHYGSWDLDALIYIHRNEPNPVKIEDYEAISDKEIRAMQKWMKSNILIFDLSIYDHSGVTIFHGTSSGWDTGQVGFHYTTKERIKKNFCCKKVTKKHWDHAKTILQNEVTIYDDYLRGNVYGFKAYKKQICPHCNRWELIEEDSCWGFIGNLEESGLIGNLPPEYQILVQQ